jgi:transcriptional regulator with XRE-family HTH domain
MTHTNSEAEAETDPTDPAEESRSLAGRVRELRESHSMTQSQLARASGLSRAYIKTIEDGGAKEPSARTIGRLCLALEADALEFMQLCGAIPEEYRESQFQEELDMVMYLRRQRRLSEQFVNTLMRLIRLAEVAEAPEDTYTSLPLTAPEE